jgi:hypothetical protein
MPRQARIDAPGALHHVIVRGIERRKIFKDNTDRLDFLMRLGKVLSDTHTRCFAWALIPNHFHLLLRNGNRSLATVKRRLLTMAMPWDLIAGIAAVDSFFKTAISPYCARRIIICWSLCAIFI